ncbi:hypothetical protein [Saccharothrix deserti]|uniref:hypothetical protein n=1 Tax=Saccharothrix deserti TaxID=2593674 RepID=UPI001EE41717|nr:hypothetical protein [Saccharothrix deserti]
MVLPKSSAMLGRVTPSRRTAALLVTAAALFAAVFVVFTLAGQAQPPRIPAEVRIGESAPPTSATTAPSTSLPPTTSPPPTTQEPPPPQAPLTTVVPPPPPVGDDDDDDD